MTCLLELPNKSSSLLYFIVKESIFILEIRQLKKLE